MKKIILLVVATLTASSSAFAHPGHGLESGFFAGLLHPLTGWDHLLVMFALGIWAARRPAAQGWQLPLLFVSMMTLSATLAAAWMPVAVAETLVAASVIFMGLLLSGLLQVSPYLQIGIVIIAGIAHGHLHGVELHSQWQALAGMLLATSALHALGWWLGKQKHLVLQKLTACLGTLMLGLGLYALMA